jgi:hypothetical protein
MSMLMTSSGSVGHFQLILAVEVCALQGAVGQQLTRVRCGGLVAEQKRVACLGS